MLVRTATPSVSDERYATPPTLTGCCSLVAMKKWSVAGGQWPVGSRCLEVNDAAGRCHPQNSNSPLENSVSSGKHAEHTSGGGNPGGKEVAKRRKSETIISQNRQLLGCISLKPVLY